MADYVHIQVKPGTKERFLELGKMSDTQDSVLVRLLDEHDSCKGLIFVDEETLKYVATNHPEFGTMGDFVRDAMKFWEKYHDYEEQIECDLELHGIFTGKFEGE